MLSRNSLWLALLGRICGGSLGLWRLPGVGRILWSCVGRGILRPGIVRWLLRALLRGTSAMDEGAVAMQNAESILLMVRCIDSEDDIAVLVLVGVVVSFFIGEAHGSKVADQIISAGSSE